MTDQQTLQGSLLGAGVALESAGMTFLMTPTWWVGLVLIIAGVGVFFAREYIK